MRFFSQKTSPSAEIIANRTDAFAARAPALRAALAARTSAREQLAAVKANIADVEREISALAPPPDLDEAGFESHEKRQRFLQYRLTEEKNRAAAAEAKLHAAEAAVEESRQALATARAEVDAPVPSSPADLPRLKNDAAKSRAKVAAAQKDLTKAEAEAEAAAAALSNVCDIGAAEDEARRIMRSDIEARDKLAEARAAFKTLDGEARAAESRVEQLEQAINQDARARTLAAGVARLAAKRDAVETGKQTFNTHGQRAAGAILTCRTFLNNLNQAHDRAHGDYRIRDFSKLFLCTPEFDAAYVPILGDAGHAFVSSHYSHDYRQFDPLDDLAGQLPKVDSRSDFQEIVRAAGPIFEREYRKIAEGLKLAMALMFVWLQERENVFAAAGEAARDVARPAFPIRWNESEFHPWRKVRLPAFGRGSPLWLPEWEASRLLDGPGDDSPEPGEAVVTPSRTLENLFSTAPKEVAINLLAQ